MNESLSYLRLISSRGPPDFSHEKRIEKLVENFSIIGLFLKKRFVELV